MSFAIRSCIAGLVFLIFIQDVEGKTSEPVLQKSYGHSEDITANQLIEEIAGTDSATIYRNLPRAVEILQPVLKKRTDLQKPVLPMLFEAYIQLKNTPMAEQTAVAYLKGLDEHNRAMFEDIRIVASPEDARLNSHL